MPDGVPFFTDLDELLPRADAVILAIPTESHQDVGARILAAGRHLLIEKPMAVDARECGALEQSAADAGRVLRVGHVERMNGAYRAVRDRLRTPRFVEGHRLAAFDPRGTDVDVILDLMIHDIDIVLKFVPAPIQRIDSVGVPVLSPNVDIANVRMHFEDGTVANMTASRVSVKKTRKIRFFQRDAYVSVDYEAGKAQIFRRVSGSDEGSPEIVGDEIAVGQSDALLSELEAFVESVRTRKPPEVGGAEGKKALQVALRILRKMRTA